MNGMNDDELNESERDLFRRLKKDFGVPGLEDKVVGSLESERLIRVNRSASFLRWAAMLLLGASIFYVGRFSGASKDNFQYVLLLHGNAEVGSVSARERFLEYKTWAEKIRESGVAITGEKLAGDVNWVAPADYSGSQDIIGGFFMINVASEAEAMAIAKASPHAKYKGTVEVRKIVKE